MKGSTDYGNARAPPAHKRDSLRYFRGRKKNAELIGTHAIPEYCVQFFQGLRSFSPKFYIDILLVKVEPYLPHIGFRKHIHIPSAYKIYPKPCIYPVRMPCPSFRNRILNVRHPYNPLVGLELDIFFPVLIPESDARLVASGRPSPVNPFPTCLHDPFACKVVNFIPHYLLRHPRHTGQGK